jgi:hypothetical protein
VLRRAAVAVFELAVAALPALEPPEWVVDDLRVVLERRVRRGLCPADLALDGETDPTRPLPGRTEEQP